MTKDGAKIYIMKLEAARRQIDSAIRMQFGNEDALAIHTVAAAAYQIIRDIKKNRGRNELQELIQANLLEVAADLAAGNISAIPPELAINPFDLIIGSLVCRIKDGELICLQDISLKITGDAKFWQNFNQTANFLKHADRDPKALLLIKEDENSGLLTTACRSYAETVGHLTPTMEAFLWSRVAAYEAEDSSSSAHAEEEDEII